MACNQTQLVAAWTYMARVKTSAMTTVCEASNCGGEFAKRRAFGVDRNFEIASAAMSGVERRWSIPVSPMIANVTFSIGTIQYRFAK